MKIFSTVKFILLLFVVFQSDFVKGQCTLSATYAGSLVPTTGTVFATYSTYSPGTYFGLPVLNGGSYAISTCGSSIDSQLTGYHPTTSAVLFYNDDNGPLCSGSSASVDNFIPNFTGFANVQVSQFNCLPGGSASINIYIRQNNNLSITSSNSSMCSGQTRGLTGTPSSLGSVPSGFGDSGTFTGTGVSGTVFTAPTVSAATVYTVTYTYGFVSKTQTILVNPNPTISVPNYTICSGNSATLVPSGAGSYTFSGGSAIVSPTILTSYSVTGTSTEGCVSSNTAISSVSVFSLPIVSVNSGSICSGNSFTIVPSGASTYTFQGGSAVVSPTASTNYTVTGTSTQGCNSTLVATSNVTVYSRPVVNVGNYNVCLGNTVTLMPGGGATYTFSSGSATLAPTSNTSVSIIAANVFGCVSSNTAVSSIVVNTVPVVAVNSGSICSGSPFTMITSGANTYTITGGMATVSPTVNSNYSVTGTSAQGCVSSNTAVSSVTVIALPSVSVNSGAICSGKSFTIVPSGANTYTITGGTATVSPITSTSYSVTGISAQGCVSSNTAVSSVTVNALPSISVNSGSVCSGSQFVMVPSGASTYTYSGGSASVSPLVNTSYSVTGTSAQGCVSSNTAVSSVTVNALPSISVNSGSVCSGSQFVMVPSGASTYTYSGGSATVSPLVNTSYSVTGTSAQGCVSSNTAVSNVTVSASPTINVSGGTICSGQQFVINPSGANSYTYSGGSATVSPSSTTSYTVNGTGTSGCNANPAIITISVNASPTISATSTGTYACIGVSQTLSASGANTYTWTGSIVASSIVVNPSVPTVYTVTGSNSITSCQANNTVAISIIVSPQPTLGATQINTAVCNGSSLTLSTGGSGTTYSWTGGVSGGVPFVPLTGNSYSATAINTLSGCQQPNALVVNVTVVAIPVITVTAVNPVICFGATTAINAIGANGYSLSSGLTNSIGFAPQNSNTYTVTGLNYSGNTSCSSAPVVVGVTVNPIPLVTVTKSHSVICAGETATISLSGANSYTWNTGSNATVVVIPSSVVASVNYTVEFSSSAGCTNVAVFTQTVSECLAIHQKEDDEMNINLYPNPSDGQVTLQFTAGDRKLIQVFNATGQLIYIRSTEVPEEKFDLSNYAKGVYYFKITGASGSRTIKLITQ